MRPHSAFAPIRSACRYLAENWRAGLTIFAFTGTGAMRRIRLAPAAVLVTLLLLAGTGLLSGGLILHAARYGLDLARTVRLEQENIELAARLAAQAEQLTRLTHEMGRLHELETMIRTISGMESEGERPLIGTGDGGLQGRALLGLLRE